MAGRTDTCARRRHGRPRSAGSTGVQFHPEVVHTARGREYLANFVFACAAACPDWDPRHRVPLIEQEIRDCVGGRNVFFFVSGGVDSSVAFALCTRALGEDRVRGVYVDTGLMREGETDFVRRVPGRRRWSMPQSEFLSALAGVTDPEAEAPHHRRRIRARAGARDRARQA